VSSRFKEASGRDVRGRELRQRRWEKLQGRQAEMSAKERAALPPGASVGQEALVLGLAHVDTASLVCPAALESLMKDTDPVQILPELLPWSKEEVAAIHRIWDQVCAEPGLTVAQLHRQEAALQARTIHSVRGKMLNVFGSRFSSVEDFGKFMKQCNVLRISQLTEEQFLEMCVRNRDNVVSYWQSLSPEAYAQQCANISARMIRYWQSLSPEAYARHGANISAGMVRYWQSLSPEAYALHCANISAGMVRYWQSLTKEEYELLCSKISAGMRRYWASLSEEEYEARRLGLLAARRQPVRRMRAVLLVGPEEHDQPPQGLWQVCYEGRKKMLDALVFPGGPAERSRLFRERDDWFFAVGSKDQMKRVNAPEFFYDIRTTCVRYRQFEDPAAELLLMWHRLDHEKLFRPGTPRHLRLDVLRRLLFLLTIEQLDALVFQRTVGPVGALSAASRTGSFRVDGAAVPAGGSNTGTPLGLRVLGDTDGLDEETKCARNSLQHHRSIHSIYAKGLGAMQAHRRLYTINFFSKLGLVICTIGTVDGTLQGLVGRVVSIIVSGGARRAAGIEEHHK
jgi:preprotein translocase subunit Sec61beta